MAKFYGDIGYITTTEIRPGYWGPSTVRRPYSGDVIRQVQRWQQTDKVNDDISTSHQISIVGDPFAYSNIPNMKFVNWLGVDWRIVSIDIQRPRIVLSLGGVYNES